MLKPQLWNMVPGLGIHPPDDILPPKELSMMAMLEFDSSILAYLHGNVSDRTIWYLWQNSSFTNYVKYQIPSPELSQQCLSSHLKNYFQNENKPFHLSAIFKIISNDARAYWKITLLKTCFRKNARLTLLSSQLSEVDILLISQLASFWGSLCS